MNRSSSGSIAYIGLGSNLDDPLYQVTQAFDELNGIVRSACTARSPIYSSPPMGPRDQPDYINAVARLETWLGPHDLLRALWVIEQQHGRVRQLRWGARTLDLDLLLYGDAIIDSPELKVPHPGLQQRPFVLYPLQDIDPALMIPGVGRLTDLIRVCPSEGLVRLDPKP